jgi:DNA-directed RNA polymerase subunit omega
MLYPEINKLRDKAGSRYYLVSMAAKRARDLIAGWDPERGYRKLDSTIETDKPVSIAAEEIARGLFTYIPAEELPDEEEAEAMEAAEEAEPEGTAPEEEAAETLSVDSPAEEE